MKTVLLLGRHEFALTRVEKLLQRNNYETISCLEDSQAEEHIQNSSFDAMIIGGGVEIESKKNMIELLKSKKPQAKLIEHFGGSMGIVEELNEAFGGAPAPKSQPKAEEPAEEAAGETQEESPAEEDTSEETTVAQEESTESESTEKVAEAGASEEASEESESEDSDEEESGKDDSDDEEEEIKEEDR